MVSCHKCGHTDGMHDERGCGGPRIVRAINIYPTHPHRTCPHRQTSNSLSNHRVPR